MIFHYKYNFRNAALFSLILVSCYMVGCKKFLDRKANPEQVVPSTLRDLQAILDNRTEMNENGSGLALASDDDNFMNDGSYQAIGDYGRQVYTWQPIDYLSSSANDWARSYKAVYCANLVLDLIKHIPRTNLNMNDWDNVYGSALFFRSYYFLQLASVFSKAYDKETAQNDLGIPLRLSSDFNKPSFRSSVIETYARVIADAMEAENKLPNHPKHVVRPSKAAVYGLLARAYLYMQQYDSAGRYANKCLQIKKDLIDYKSEINPNTSVPFSIFNKETIFYVRIFDLGNVSNTNIKVDTLLFSEYSDNDLRRSAFFGNSGVYKIFKGSYTGSSSQKFSGLTTSEMLLIRAECYARTGNAMDAINDLNELLKNRYTASFIPYIGLTQTEIFALILKERRKELLFRGLRWMDIKRLNKEGANITPRRKVLGRVYSLTPNDRRYALTIPASVIDLTGMKQN